MEFFHTITNYKANIETIEDNLKQVMGQIASAYNSNIVWV